MFSTISRTVSCARSTLVFNADTVWKTDDESNIKRKNLEEWVRLNRLERLLKRTTVSDSFSLVVKSRIKTVRCIIPFRPLLVLGNHGYDECREYVYTAEFGEVCQVDLDRVLETSVEPWMLPEVEDAFTSISKGLSAPDDFTQCCSREISESYPCCGQLYSYYKPTTISYSAFDHEKQKSAHSSAHVHQLSSILEEATKKARLIRENLTEYRFRMLDFSSALKLVRYPQLIFPVINLDIPYEVKEVEIAADFAGKCYQHPVCEDSLRKPVSDDDIKRYPLPRLSINNQKERLLSYKIHSENVRELWSSCSFKLMGNQKVRRINFFDKKVEISNWTSCVCHRCFPQPKRKKVKIKSSESKSRISQTTKQSSPIKQRELNVEVPEFYPRREDAASRRDAGQKYFSSLVPPFPQHYNQPQWYGNTYNPVPFPPTATHLTYNASTFGLPNFNYPQPQFNFSPEFIAQMARQYWLQNYQNMQQYPQQIAPNNFVPNPQMAIEWNQHSHPLNRVPQSPSYSARPSCPMTFQQTWPTVPFPNQYQQPPSPQQTQLAHLYQSAQQLQHLQSQTNELTNLYQQKWQNEAASQKIQPKPETEMALPAPRMQLPESSKTRQASPPKNIPVFQRPPESYVSAQGDGSNKRRHGSGGGGGVVVSNLIVLTKASRCKDSRNKICPAEVQVPEDKGTKVMENDNDGGLERYNNTDGKFVNPFQCLSKQYLLESIPEAVSEAEDLAGIESVEISTDIPKDVTVDSLTEDLCQEGCNDNVDFLKDSMTITSPEMTSTPKKNRKKKRSKRDRFKWLDASNPDVQSTNFRQPSFSEVSLTVPSPVVESELKFKQKRDLSHELKAKTSYSDPSFPPIKTYQSNSRLLDVPNISSTPSTSGCHRKLYRDVLAPNVDFPSCQAVSAQTAGVSMSEDSLDVHYGELEKLAVEQYESSNDSISRAYKKLEYEAIEQYCCSCGSFAKSLPDTEKSHMDLTSGCKKGGGSLSDPRNVSGNALHSISSTEFHRQASPEERKLSEEQRVVILMKAKSKKSYSKIANGDSSSDDERGTKGNSKCDYQTKDKEIFTIANQDNFALRNMGEDRNEQIKDTLKIGESSKRITTVGASKAKYNKNYIASEFNIKKSVQQETPNDQRTQVSTTTGNKSVREKEDLVGSAEVPEAWVQKRQLRESVADDCTYAESIRYLFEPMGNEFESRPEGEPVDEGRKKRRRRKKKRKNRKLVTVPCIHTIQDEHLDGVNVKYDGYFPEERGFDHREDVSITMADVSANDVLVCEELMRVITMEDISEPCPEISSKPFEAIESGSNSISTATIDLQEAISEPTVFSKLEENYGEFTGTGETVIQSKDGIFLQELTPYINEGGESEIITIYENKLLDSPQTGSMLTQRCNDEGRFLSKEVEKRSLIQSETVVDVGMNGRMDLRASQRANPFDETILNLFLDGELLDSSQSYDLPTNLSSPRHSLSAPTLQSEISTECLAKHSGPLCSNSTPTMPCKASSQSSTSSPSGISSSLYNSGLYKLLGISKKVPSPRNTKPSSMPEKQTSSCSLQ